jgi:hypothetical protein
MAESFTVAIRAWLSTFESGRICIRRVFITSIGLWDVRHCRSVHQFSSGFTRRWNLNLVPTFVSIFRHFGNVHRFHRFLFLHLSSGFAETVLVHPSFFQVRHSTLILILTFRQLKAIGFRTVHCFSPFVSRRLSKTVMRLVSVGVVRFRIRF